MNTENAIDGVDVELIDENLVKFTPRKNAKFDQSHVDQLNRFIENNFSSKIAYLVDGKNFYESNFDSMKGFTSSNKLVAVAYLVYEEKTRDRVRYLNIFPARSNRDVEIKPFDNESDALAWLRRKLAS